MLVDRKVDVLCLSIPRSIKCFDCPSININIIKEIQVDYYRHYYVILNCYRWYYIPRMPGKNILFIIFVDVLQLL